MSDTSCAPLPHNPTVLAALMQSINQAIDYVEPLRQQMNHQARILGQLERGI